MSCNHCKENLGKAKHKTDPAQTKLVRTSQEFLPHKQTATKISLTNGLPSSKGKDVFRVFTHKRLSTI